MTNKWYEEHKAALQAEQATKTRQEIAAELATKSEHVFDPATAQPIRHNWIKRGIKMSCEGAGHPHHQTWIPHTAGPM